MKKILAYGFDSRGQKINNIKELASSYNIDIKLLSKEDIFEKVESLMDFKEVEQQDIREYIEGDTEFLLFSDFDRNILREFIASMNKKGLSVVHKAVITENNKSWTFKYLIDHIRDEHKLVKKYEKLGIMVKKAQKLFETNPSEELDKAIKYCLTIKTIKDISEKDIDERYNIINDIIN